MSAKDMQDILTPTVTRSLSDEAADRIRDAILSGKLEPGARLREESLSGSLAVSRGPVREALVKLEREGLVIVSRHRGAVVARLSVEDLEEVYSLRQALERLAVQRMMRFGDATRLAELEQVITELAMACARGITTQEAAELDLRFHDIIYQAARHRRLYDCWKKMQAQIHIMLLTRHVSTPGFRKSIVKRHQELLDAIRSGKERLAQDALESHLRESYEHVAQSYTRFAKTRAKRDGA